MLAEAPYALGGMLLVLAAASYLAWNWLIQRLGGRESPLSYEPRPPLRLADLDSILAWFGFVPEKFGSDVRYGAVAFLIAVAPIYALQALLTIWIPYEHPLIEELRQKHDPATLQRIFVLAVFFAPLVEELIFRVLLQGTLEALERRWHRHVKRFRGLPRGTVPIAMSSLAFALAHVDQGPAPVPLFFFALVLGYLYRQTHRIVPSIVTHACLNATTMVMLWLSL